MADDLPPALPEPGDAEVLGLLEPEVRRWFEATFPALTPPQRHAVREVAAGRHVLVASPTGSGKTLAAFLAAISDLVARWKAGTLDDRVHVVYVSPLKALGNDVERNLRAPLEGVQDVFLADRREAPPIRVGVRTGDTSAAARAAMTKRPPHILITTPESLALVLAAPRFGAALAGVRYVIVDEVHALAANKRGTHLALSLERLAARCAADPVRVGLSATIAPLDLVGRFLFGDREGRVVDVTAAKGLEVHVDCPVEDPTEADPRDVREAVDAALESVLDAHATTIVFTNTRNATERVAYRLRERWLERLGLPPDPEGTDPRRAAADARVPVGAHHGSLSREVRFAVEERLKRGELRCVVTSTSLELGIDVGSVDRVVLLGSPKGASRALQRIGRAGHRLTAVSRGLLLSTDRDDLVECLAVAREARARRPDPVEVPEGCLDVLAQHLLGVALAGEQRLADVLATFRRAWPYRDLAEDDARAVLEHLAGRRAASQGRGRLGWDPLEGRFWARAGARLSYFRTCGTIPSSSHVKVYAGPTFVGELEEGFVEELEVGDVFSLDGRAWRFQGTAGMHAHVRPAPGDLPTVPRWGHEMLPLTPQIAAVVAERREAWADALAAEGVEALAHRVAEEEDLPLVAATVVARYVALQAAFSAVPRADEFLVETFPHDDGRRWIVVHAPLGRRANEALARAFARSLAEGAAGGVSTAASDLAFGLLVPRGRRVGPREARALFEAELRPRVVAALEGSELVRRRFRHVAERGHLLARPEEGRQAVGRQQVSARILWSVLRRADPDHPMLRETWREVLHDALDLPTAERACADVRAGRRRVRVVPALPAPSPFAFHLLAHADDGVASADRRAILRDLQERVHERLADARREPR